MTSPTVVRRPSRDATASVPGARRDDIQGLRAVAVVMVVAFHAGLPVPGGFVGVDVFFVISGFVITGMLLREWNESGRIRFGRFYARRFKRLTPALALVVTATMILTAVVISPLGPQQNAAVTAIGAMLLSSNIVIANTTGGYFSVAAETNPLLNVWSLSVEEQFYLAFPFLLVAGWAIARRRPRLAVLPVVLVSAVLVVSFLLALVDEGGLAFPGSKDALGFYSPVPRAWEFAIGAVAALVLAGRRARAPRAAALWGALGVIGLAASLFVIGEATPFPGAWTLLPTVSTLLLIVAGWQDPGNHASRMLSTRPMARIGDWSYSIYLWHWPFIVLATTLWRGVPWVPLLAALVSLVPAILSYRFVEQPLRSRTYDRRGLAVLFTATMVPPLLSALLVLAGSAAGYGSPVIRGYQEASGQHIGTSCGNTGGEAGATIACSFNTDAGGPPVYLVSDSHADAISDAVVGAAERLGRPASARIAPGCQLIEGSIGSVGGEPLRACEEYFATTMRWLTGAEPGVVVISSAARPFWEPEIQLGPDEGSMSTVEDVKLEYLLEELTQSVLLLEAAGHTVVLVQDVPTFTEPYSYAPTECSLPALVAGGCDRVLPLAVAEDQQAGVRETIEAVAAATGAVIWDLRPEVCDESGCPSRRGDLVAYSDDDHLSVGQAEQLVDEVTAVLSAQ
jgi:peptidoglycan/LPS O-acetylase OafA/YrhL